MQLEGHPDARRHDAVQQVHIGKHPLVPGRRDPEVSLEECMEAVEERLQAVKRENNNSSCIPGGDRRHGERRRGGVALPGRHAVRGRAQSSPAQDAQPETQPSSTYLVAATSQASQRWPKAALNDSMWGRWPGSQQQQPSSSSTPSVMASTSLCWQ
ncbi:hypothetical protein EYF80_013479 [Liparis tanakae]|uniref:Uncharacterized protein n=1 Tax=Liparis tanakae TaxID=230148 RepID=A0A4Z2IEJ8_9TELE|nr:hypothetical protein EYF80_013479 [Liparis tanakae]